MNLSEEQKEKIRGFHNSDELLAYLKTENPGWKQLDADDLDNVTGGGGTTIQKPGNYELSCPWCGEVVKGYTRTMVHQALYYHLTREHAEK